jgi:hypothetical protein
MNTNQIIAILQSGASWTAVFRAILAEVVPEERSRMVLFRELQSHFDVRIETLSMIGGWDYWTSGGYDDTALNEKLQGKLLLKGGADSARQAQRG